jgi:glycosyltransferase involved in cell wall biosynthesis
VVNRTAFAVPGDLATPTGGYGYDRRIIAELQVLGWQIDVVSVGDGFPQPSAEQRAVALARLEDLPQGIPVVVDGLALGALPEAAERIARRAPLVALVHHPLALEAGLSPADSRKLFESECKALAAARSVIVTSRATGKRLNADYDVPPERITVAPPGTDRAAPARGTPDGTLRLLSVAAIVPRKGFDALIAALASIAGLPWRLTIAGDLTRAPATAAKLEADIERHRLAGRVNLLGAVSPQQLAAQYSTSRAMAWRTRRRWRTVCRSSARRAARPWTRCPRLQACWSSQGT